MRLFGKKTYGFAIAIVLVCAFAFFGKTEANAADWELVWNDEFDGNSLDTSKWCYDIGTGSSGWGNNEWQYYTSDSDNVSVSNGALKISAIKENYGGCSYTSGRIKTLGLKTFKYGKIEFRIKAPVGQGLWPAAWMLGKDYPNEAWPQCGEIDVFEHVNTEDKIYGTVHWDSDGYATYGGNKSGVDVTQYHTYSIEWDKDYIVWYLDGSEYHRILITDSTGGTDEFHQEFYLLLNLAVGGNWPGSPNGTASFPANMYVDYVRVYQQSGSGSSSGGTSGGSASGGSTTSTSLQDDFNNWTFYSGSDWAGAYAGNVVNSSNQTTFTVANAGYGGEWGIQFYDNSVPLQTGKTYKVSFDILSWNTKSVGFYLQNNGTDLINQRIYLTGGQKQSVSYVSQAAVSDLGAIYFSLGAYNSSENNSATTIVLSNFKIEEVGSQTSGGNTGNTGNTGETSSASNGVAYTSNNSATATLTGTSWADIHYSINGAAQQNVRMTQSGTTSTYVIKGLKSGDTVSYWYTYSTGSGAVDTQSYSYVHGQSASS